MNGRNLVYSHVESVKRLLEREFGNDDGVLYEGTVTDFYPEWEDSLELKSGSERSAAGGSNSWSGRCTPLKEKLLPEEGTPTRILVPTDLRPDRWQERFRRRRSQGTGGTGYDPEGRADDRRTRRSRPARQHGVGLRRLRSISRHRPLTRRRPCLQLIRDGFVALLNGREIAQRTRPRRSAGIHRLSRRPHPIGSVRFKVDGGTSFSVGKTFLRSGPERAPDSTDLLCITELTVDDHDIVGYLGIGREDPFYRFWY